MLGIYIRTSREDESIGTKESPIEQQKQAGIQFALEHSFSYEVYEDKGISGFKIADDDINPFKNRPRFTDLMEDIRAGKVTKVWVWEHSRLSRNQYASGRIFLDFERHKIQLFERDKEFNLNDPQSKLFRSILDSMSEYERSLIVERTTRGSHSRINQGKRTFGKLYGYKKAGTDSSGYQILEPVPSEQENIKYAHKCILSGESLRHIALTIHNSSGKKTPLILSNYWKKIIGHFSYTGYELNMAGLEILKKFENFEIDNLSIINDEQYYTSSQNYPHKLISIVDWVRIMEKLRTNRPDPKTKLNRASKDIATGLIVCSECGEKYYSTTQKRVKNGHTYFYDYYLHYIPMERKKCYQKQLFSSKNFNEIFKLLYFYHYIFFDNTGEMLEEAQRLAKVKMMKLKEEVALYTKNEKQLRRQVEKFESVLDETENKDEIKILARRISETENKLKENYDSLAKSKIELEQLQKQYAENEGKDLHGNAKEKVLNFFKMNTEEQRNNLIAIIKNCFIFGTNLLIDTGNTVFIFDTTIKHFFDEKLLDGLAQEKIYKEHFVGLFNNEDFIEKDSRTETIKESIFNPSGLYLYEADLSIAADKKSVLELFKMMNIQYDISGHKSVVFDLPERLE